MNSFRECALIAFRSNLYDIATLSQLLLDVILIAETINFCNSAYTCKTTQTVRLQHFRRRRVVCVSYCVINNLVVIFRLYKKRDLLCIRVLCVACDTNKLPIYIPVQIDENFKRERRMYVYLFRFLYQYFF